MDCMISGTGPCKQLIQCYLIFWVNGINHLVLTLKKSKQNKFDIKIIYLPIFGKTWNLGHWTHCWHQIESDTKYCTNITRVAPGSRSKNLAYTIHTNQLPWIQYHTPSTQPVSMDTLSKQTSCHGYTNHGNQSPHCTSCLHPLWSTNKYTWTLIHSYHTQTNLPNTLVSNIHNHIQDLCFSVWLRYWSQTSQAYVSQRNTHWQIYLIYLNVFISDTQTHVS